MTASTLRNSDKQVFPEYPSHGQDEERLSEYQDACVPGCPRCKTLHEPNKHVCLANYLSLHFCWYWRTECKQQQSLEVSGLLEEKADSRSGQEMCGISLGLLIIPHSKRAMYQSQVTRTQELPQTGSLWPKTRQSEHQLAYGNNCYNGLKYSKCVLGSEFIFF